MNGQFCFIDLFCGIAGIYPPYFLLKLEGRHRLSMGLFLFLAAACAGLELLFAAGLGMGMTGIALGCSLANVSTALAGWVFLLDRRSSFRLCSLSGAWPLAARLLTAGSPAALNNLCSVLRSVALNRMIFALAGRSGLSAFSVVSMAFNLTLILINGLGQTTSPFVGVFSSERDGSSLRQIERQAVKLGLTLIVPAALALALLAAPFCRLFGVADAAALAVFLHRHTELCGPLLLERRYEAGRFIAFSVHSTPDEITDASARISSFCEENALAARQSMMIALSLEEMLVSIQEHCFPDDPSQSINVRILIAPEDESGERPVILRIRCSGVPFNPIDYYERRKAETAGQLDKLDALLEGPDDSLGIAMIVSAAHTVDYKTTFGVNNLTVIL